MLNHNCQLYCLRFDLNEKLLSQPSTLQMNSTTMLSQWYTVRPSETATNCCHVAWKSNLFVCLFVFYVPSTAMSLRDGNSIY